MISFATLGEHGRLGNQLHQYAVLKAVSIRTGYDIVLPDDLHLRSHHGQQCLLRNFKLPSASFGILNVSQTFYERGYRIYDESVFEVNDGTNFSGHFEHQRYASDIRDELLNEFTMLNEIEDKTDAILSRYNSPIVSLHIRRGDLVTAPPEESQWSTSFSEGSIYHSYYHKAMSLVPKNSIFLLFSGGARLSGDALHHRNLEDLKWCHDNISDSRVIPVSDLNDIETFCLMKKCDFNITSYGSTFSWWASFLNPKQNIIAPKVFFPTKKFSDFSIDQFYPSNWTLI